MTSAEDGVIRRRVSIVNERGLHARAAAKFVKLAEQFDAEIIVSKSPAGTAGAPALKISFRAGLVSGSPSPLSYSISSIHSPLSEKVTGKGLLLRSSIKLKKLFVWSLY